MDRPVCKCHGEPMRRSGFRDDGRQIWRCTINARANDARCHSRYDRGEKGRAREERRRETERASRRMLVSLANRHGCFRCGSRGRLHRHHISPADKAFSIGRHYGAPFEEFARELFEETIPLCPPCHVQEHRDRPLTETYRPRRAA